MSLFPTAQEPRQLIQFTSKQLKRKYPALASGTFGVVYKGKAEGIPAKIIIKDLSVDHVNACHEWKNEIELLGYNRYSRYVVSVFGYCFDKKKISIVMEYMPNGSLYDYIQSEVGITLTLLQRLRMARHCARAVCFLHANSIIHRDIKSPNLLVADDLSLKLADFGCAKILKFTAEAEPDKKPAPLIRQHTANIGSPLWMAPEVGSGIYSYPADVYSIAIVVYEILDGRLPKWDRANKSIRLPEKFLGREIIVPFLNPIPEKRPKAEDLLAMLDSWTRNFLIVVNKHLGETDKFKKVNLLNLSKSESIDEALETLYNYLLSEHPGKIDYFIARAVPDPSPRRLEQLAREIIDSP